LTEIKIYEQSINWSDLLITVSNRW